MPTIAYGPRIQAGEYDQENGEAGYQRIGLVSSVKWPQGSNREDRLSDSWLENRPSLFNAWQRIFRFLRGRKPPQKNKAIYGYRHDLQPLFQISKRSG